MKFFIKKESMIATASRPTGRSDKPVSPLVEFSNLGMFEIMSAYISVVVSILIVYQISRLNLCCPLDLVDPHSYYVKHRGPCGEVVPAVEVIIGAISAIKVNLVHPWMVKGVSNCFDP